MILTLTEFYFPVTFTAERSKRESTAVLRTMFLDHNKSYTALVRWYLNVFTANYPSLLSQHRKPVDGRTAVFGLSYKSALPTITCVFRGTRWCSWLKHSATSRKVAGSISDGVTGIFHWHNPSGRTMTLELTQPLTESGTRNNSWG
jgi:hypothetical protein